MWLAPLQGNHGLQHVPLLRFASRTMHANQAMRSADLTQ